MPAIDQYTLEHRELIELLIKQAGVTEGKWALLVNFNVAVGSFGPTQEQVRPGVALSIEKIGIQRAPENAVQQGLVVDAAVLNKPTRPKKRA